MSMELDMKEIERKVYLVYHEDGLIDIVLGLVFAAWGMFLVFGPPFLVFLIGPMALVIYYFGKRDITIPRIGIIEPAPRMARRISNLLLTLLLIGITALVGIWLLASGDKPGLGSYSLGIVGLVVAVGVCILGYLLYASRLYAYAALLFVAFATGAALIDRITAVDMFLVSVISAGFIILLCGLVVLARFVRRYPLPVEDHV